MAIDKEHFHKNDVGVEDDPQVPQFGRAGGVSQLFRLVDLFVCAKWAERVVEDVLVTQNVVVHGDLS